MWLICIKSEFVNTLIESTKNNKTMKKSLFVFVYLFFSFTILNAQNYNDAVKWMKDNTIEIKTVKAESGLKDLLPLKTILKDKRIVALGEATHGTKDFFQMKHRMLEFLVKEMGFRCFAIEANFTEALAVNDYVMNGNGDPQKALDGLYFWTWNTKEVLAMIEWMRNYNKNRQDADKVKFYGFDMQTPKIAAYEFQKYLHNTDSVYEKEINEFLVTAGSISENSGPSYVAEVFNKYKNLISSINTKLEENTEKYISRTDKHSFLIAKQNFRIITQFIELASASDMKDASQIRDKAMAENVRWLLDFEGQNSKFVLWAHNGHIANNFVDNDGITMGYHLKNFHKENYYALGFDFHKGSFQAVDTTKGLIKFDYQVKNNSTGAIFSKVKKDNFFLDFASAKTNTSMKEFLNASLPSICIGAIFSYLYSDSFYIKRPLVELYDGIIFINKTKRAEPISKERKYASNDFGNLMSHIRADKFEGKQIRFSAYLKTGEKTTNGQGQLWVRIDKKDKTIGFFDNMDNRPIISKDWKRAEIAGIVDKDAQLIVFGCMFIGEGELFADNFKLEYFENDQWLPIEIDRKSVV